MNDKSESTEFATRTPASMERPAFVKAGDVRGTEHIGKDDIQLPRLALAQALSPQLNETDAKFIENLRIGQMFNNLTGEVLGKGPLEFTIVRADPPRGVEFFPREEGGGIKDFNVPLTDPRMLFGPNGERPVATKFYDFVILLLPSLTLIALSMKGSGLKVARQLNSLLKLRALPSFACKFRLATVQEKNSKGTFFNFAVRNDGNVTEEVYHYAERVFEAIKDKRLDIEREAEDEPGDTSEATSFDTDRM